jgi:CheY-like chemotaxis protein
MVRKKIAIIEDEGIVAMDIRKSLEILGYEVPFVVDTASKAFKKLEETKVDMVLMDIILKGDMDGIEAAKIILEIRNIPIVFLTAFEDETTLERAMLTNTHGYLIKPFTDEKLKSVIDKAVVPYQKYIWIEDIGPYLLKEYSS